MLDGFLEALESEDVPTLMNLLSTADETLQVTEKTVEDLLTYFNEFPDEKDKLVEELKHSARSQNGEGNSAGNDENEEDESEQPFITFEKKGKKFFIYDNYEFVIYPQLRYVYFNHEDVKFFVDDEEISIEWIDDETALLGPFLPGNYQLKGILSTDFFELEKELEVQLFGETFAELYFDIAEVYIDSVIDGASIYVNGKDTGLILESNGYYFEPALLDGSMEMYFVKETPFGSLKTPTYKLENDYLAVEFQMEDTEIDNVIEVVNDYLNELNEALMEKDKNMITKATGNERMRIIDQINALIQDGFHFVGYVTENTFDMNSLEIYEKDGSWNVTIDIATDRLYTFYHGNSPTDIQPKLDYLEVELTFDESEKSWLVSYTSSIYSIDFNNTIVKSFDVEEKIAAIEEMMKTVSTPEKEEFDDLLYKMVYYAVESINERDVSILEPILDPQNEQYKKEIADYINYLDSKGINHEFVGVKVTDVKEDGDSFYIVSTFEEYIIHYNDGSSTYRSFDSQYLVRQTDDGLRVNKLIDTTQVSSEDL